MVALYHCGQGVKECFLLGFVRMLLCLCSSARECEWDSQRLARSYSFTWQLGSFTASRVCPQMVVGVVPVGDGTLHTQPPYTPCIVGIYWVYHEGSLGGWTARVSSQGTTIFPYESVFGGGGFYLQARKPWRLSETAVDRIKKGLLIQETPVDSSKVRELPPFLIFFEYRVDPASPFMMHKRPIVQG